MTHFNKRDWDEYVNGQAMHCDAMEEHLLDCDDCLADYMSAVERQETPPSLLDKQRFIEEVSVTVGLAEAGAERLPDRHSSSVQRELVTDIPVERRFAGKAWYGNRVVQYVVAASITVILVGSGAFQHMVERVSDLTASAEKREKTTVTSIMTDAANSWLDTIPVVFQSRKEGNP